MNRFPAVATLVGWALVISGQGLVNPPPPATDSRSARLSGAPDDAVTPAIRAAFARLPVRFESNVGQASPGVQFMSRGKGYDLFLTNDEAVLAVAPTSGHGGGAVLRMRPVGSNRAPRISGIGRLPGLTNYLIGSNGSQWRTGIKGYSGVKYSEVYPGIDLVYHGDTGQLEYDFVVAPGADPAVIALDLSGASALRLDGRGDLVISTTGGEVRQRRPVIYQDIHGTRRNVRGEFVLRGERRVAFAVGDYDRSRPLVIDPVVVYSTMLGGIADDAAHAVAVDEEGNVYITGRTASPDFPVEDPVQDPQLGGAQDGPTRFDVFVTKLDSTGSSIVYSTFLGQRGAADIGSGIAVDAAGAAFVVGNTEGGPDFPDTASAYEDCDGTDTAAALEPRPSRGFALKLNPAGSGLDYGTCLGSGEARGVAAGLSGEVVVGGSGGPCQIEGTPANRGFVATLDTTRGGDDSLPYRRCLPDTHVHGVAVDSSGAAYATGTTSGPAPPGSFGRGGGDDAFVAKLRPAEGGILDLEYQKQIGSDVDDIALGIAVSGDGSPHITGYTRSSSGFPVSANAVPYDPGTTGTARRGFVAKLTASGDTVDYSTYLGSGRQVDGDTGEAIAVDSTGKVYVSGKTAGGLPTTPGAFQERFGGGSSRLSDGFVAQIDPHASTGPESLLYGTYLGGVADEGYGRDTAGNDYAGGIATDPAGNVYVVGSTASGDFPSVGATVPAACRRAAVWRGPCRYAGDVGDAFVAKFAFNVPTPGNITAVNPRGGPESGGTPVVLTGTGFGGTSAVAFGNVPVPPTDFRVVSDSLITAVAPRHPGGKVSVTLTGGAGTSPKSSFATFTYGEGAWTETGGLDTARSGHTATLLANGKVLVVGGCPMLVAKSACTPEARDGTASVRLFDPDAAPDDPWSDGPDLPSPRYGHTATLLKNEKVLVVGGFVDLSLGEDSLGPHPSSSALLYDPRARSWSSTGIQPVVGRALHTATVLLPGGKVLVAGGVTGLGNQATDSSELYDPVADTWVTTGPLLHPRVHHTTTHLPAGPTATCGARCGMVLAVGGFDEGATQQVQPPELFDPATATWSLSSGEMGEDRGYHTATLLPSGKVLVASGRGKPPLSESPDRNQPLITPTPSSELYDPVSDSWAYTAGLLDQARYGHAAALLASGRAVVFGGCTTSTAGGTCITRDAGVEVYREDGVVPAVWTPAGSMVNPRGDNLAGATATVLPTEPSELCRAVSYCGKVLIVGGMRRPGEAVSSAELYTPAPTVRALTPAIGPAAGGTQVTITGTGFTNGFTEVRFGSVVLPGEAYRIDSYSQITATAPAATDLASVDVTVRTPGGVSSVSPAARFTYSGAPGAIPRLTAVPRSTSTIELLFPAAGGVADTNPPARRYDVRESDSPIDTPARFEAASSLCDGPCRQLAPSRAGEELNLAVPGLDPGTTYHYAVRAVGEAGELGPMSPSASATTLGVAPTSVPKPELDRLRSGDGYWLVGSDGGVFAFGDARFAGSTGAMRLNQPIVGMARTPSGNGYWLVAADGGVFAFGDARFRGSTGGMRLNQPVVGMAATPSGNGYWLVARDGGVFAFGDARFAGSTAAMRLNQFVVAMSASPSGNGYRLVAGDGGVFAFGDASFLGSTGSLRLNRPVVATSPTPSGDGYWLVGSDGGVFAFGDARFAGSTGDLLLAQPVVGIGMPRDGPGYRLVAGDGGVFAFGGARFFGSLGTIRLNKPVVGTSSQ